ncbi:short-chain collagen C4-like [Glandiceps talaboti]
MTCTLRTPYTCLILVTLGSAFDSHFFDETSKTGLVPEPISTALDTTGVVFTRWGHNNCHAGMDLVYNGVMSGQLYSQSGNGANHLCLPIVPLYDMDNVTTGVQTDRAYLYHTEYRNPSGPFLDRQYHDIPCAVCLDGTHNNIIVYPAQNTCPDGWDVEYKGFLMAERTSYGTVDHVCVDVEGRVVLGSATDVNSAFLYSVEGRCPAGSAIPCAPYVDGYELSCVVCAI